MNLALFGILYSAVVNLLGAAHSTVDSKTDEYGMNAVDREYIESLQSQVQQGKMSEQEARDLLGSKWNGGRDYNEAYDYILNKSKSSGLNLDNLFGGSQIGDLLASLTNYYTGAHLTGAQQEANAFSSEEAQKSRDFTEYMARNKYSMETQSMQDAGINPALVYGGGSLVPTASNGAQASSVSPSMGNLFDALSVMMRLPQEIQSLKMDIANKKADTDKKKAEEKLILQQAETEKFITLIKQVDAKYADEITAQNLKNAGATYENIVKDTGMKQASTDRINTEKEAQSILNQYLDERQRAEIDKIKSEGNKLDKDAAYAAAQKVYQDWYNGFVQANDFLPSTNDYLMLGTYIASIFGISKEEVQKFFDEHNSETQNWLSRYKSKHDPSYNNHNSHSGGGKK